MPDDLNLRIARAKGGPGTPRLDWDSDPAASAELEAELCEKGSTTMRWWRGTKRWDMCWISFATVDRTVEVNDARTRYVAIARVWLAVFEGKAR